MSSCPIDVPTRRRSRALGRAAVCALGVFACVSAAAADDTFAIAVSAGADRGKVDCVATYPCDRSGGYAKLSGSYRVGDAFGLVASYIHAGRFKGGDTTPLGTAFGGRFDVDGFGLAGSYRWPLASGWGLEARAGIAAMHTRFGYAAPFEGIGSVSKTVAAPLAGLLVDYAVTPKLRLGLDYDYSRFKVYRSNGSLHLIGVSARYAF